MPAPERVRTNTAIDSTSMARLPSSRAITRDSRCLWSTSNLAQRNTPDKFSNQRSQLATPLLSAWMVTWPTIKGNTLNSISHNSIWSVGRRVRLGVSGRRTRKLFHSTAPQVIAKMASLTVLRIPRLTVEYGMNVATSANSNRPQNGKRRMVTAPARPITARNALAGDNNRATAPNNRPKRMATRLGRVILTSVPRSIRPGVGGRRVG